MGHAHNTTNNDSNLPHSHTILPAADMLLGNHDTITNVDIALLS